jgi:3-deoxy-7-phosphoheptulonate synthase
MQDLRLAKKQSPDHRTVVAVGSHAVGEGFTVMAGPCSVETAQQTLETAKIVKQYGGNILRGGAFKPRTSPYSFQGLGLEGLKILAAARKETGLPIVTEVVDPRDVSWVSEYADLLQVGARNIQNFSLLKEVGKAQKPILLKRGMHSTIEEWLYSAEYILAEGNPNVILCERGIRTFETHTRNTLDLSAVAVVKNLTHLPVIVDPTHGTGRRDLIEPLSLGAVAVGADGIMIEVHWQPDEALCDKDQALPPEEYAVLMKKVHSLYQHMQLL